jgi:hypothetical protein
MHVVVVERLPLRCRFRKSRLFTLRRGLENSSVIGKRALLPGKGVNAIPEPRACLMYAQFIPGLGLMIGNPAPLCARSELVARQWRQFWCLEPRAGFCLVVVVRKTVGSAVFLSRP